MILSVFLIVLKIKDTWITFMYYHQLILWNDLAMYYLKKCRKSINFIVQLNLNLWKTIWIDNMIKTKRRNLVQKNLKYTLGSFYFVGNKFLDCQLFNDMGCYFIISLVCTLRKDFWNFLGVLIHVWELPTGLSLNSNDCIVFKLKNWTPSLLLCLNDEHWPFLLQEHHLQRALSAQQVYGTSEALVIPIPEVDDISEHYNEMYKSDFKTTKQFIHIQGN